MIQAMELRLRARVYIGAFNRAHCQKIDNKIPLAHGDDNRGISAPILREGRKVASRSFGMHSGTVVGAHEATHHMMYRIFLAAALTPSFLQAPRRSRVLLHRRLPSTRRKRLSPSLLGRPPQKQ